MKQQFFHLSLPQNLCSLETLVVASASRSRYYQTEISLKQSPLNLILIHCD